MIGNYTQLYPLLITELPGITEPLLLQNIQTTCREFCLDTEAWTDSTSYYIVDVEATADAAYDAAILLGMSTAAADERYDLAYDGALKYSLVPHNDAEIVRIVDVWSDGDEDLTPLAVDNYRFTPATNILRFKNIIKTYTPTGEAWATGHAYTVGEYVISSNLRYLCAIAHTASAAFATDLALYRWQVMPNDLIVKAVLAPYLYSTELAGWFMEKWARGIVAGVKASLMGQKNKTWSNLQMVPVYRAQYVQAQAEAKGEVLRDNRSGELHVQYPGFE